MAAFTNEGEAQVLNNLLDGIGYQSDGVEGTTSFTPADSACFLSLWKTDPTDTGAAGTEARTPNFVGGGTDGYIRKAIKFTELDAVQTGDTTTIQNDGILTWTASGDWTTGSEVIGFFGIHLGSADAAKMIIHGALADEKPVTNGDTITIAADGISVTLT